MTETLKVYADDGQTILAEVDADLYKDFLDEVLISEQSIESYLSSLVDPENQRALNNYIVYRLAEVDPGYVPIELEIP